MHCASYARRCSAITAGSWQTSIELPPRAPSRTRREVLDAPTVIIWIRRAGPLAGRRGGPASRRCGQRLRRAFAAWMAALLLRRLSVRGSFPLSRRTLLAVAACACPPPACGGAADVRHVEKHVYQEAYSAYNWHPLSNPRILLPKVLYNWIKPVQYLRPINL